MGFSLGVGVGPLRYSRRLGGRRRRGSGGGGGSHPILLLVVIALIFWVVSHILPVLIGVAVLLGVTWLIGHLPIGGRHG